MVFLIPSALVWVGVALSAIAVAFALFFLFAVAGVALAAYAVIFSRFAFGLLIGLALSQSNALFGLTGFYNFLAWAAISLSVTFLLCKFPRIGTAVKFLTTFVLAFLAIMICVALIMGIVVSIAGGSFSMNLAYTLTILVISLVMALFSVVKDLANHDDLGNIHLKNPVALNIERLVASVMYGFVLMLAFVMGVDSFMDISVPVQYMILGGFTAVAFVADIVLPGTPFMNKLQSVSIALNDKAPTPEKTRKNMIDALK